MGFVPASVYAAAQITFPNPDSTLVSETEIFEWMPTADTVVGEWWFYLGSSPASHDLYDSGSLLGTQTITTVADLPTGQGSRQKPTWFTPSDANPTSWNTD